MHKVVITGGTGFIGSWLVEDMLEQSTEVIMLVRDAKRCKYQGRDQVTVVQYDSLEFLDLKNKKTE